MEKWSKGDKVYSHAQMGGWCTNDTMGGWQDLVQKGTDALKTSYNKAIDKVENQTQDLVQSSITNLFNKGLQVLGVPNQSQPAYQSGGVNMSTMAVGIPPQQYGPQSSSMDMLKDPVVLAVGGVVIALLAFMLFRGRSPQIIYQAPPRQLTA